MFELTDVMQDSAIIQVFGLGEKGSALCTYIKNKGVAGVNFLAEQEVHNRQFFLILKKCWMKPSMRKA